LATWILNVNQVQSVHVLGSTSTDWHLVGTGDFNGDSKTDLFGATTMDKLPNG
jgi:hypothetical protein